MEMTNGSCIVALCHFCEHHGPSSVFHTRLKDDNPTRKLISSSNSNCTVSKYHTLLAIQFLGIIFMDLTSFLIPDMYVR